MDPLHLHVGERWMLRRRGELTQLLLVVDVRKRGDDAPMRVVPQQRELRQRHAARVAQRLDALDFLQPLDQPRARAV